MDGIDQATETLQERLRVLIDDEIKGARERRRSSSRGSQPIVICWDDGGYLRDVFIEACGSDIEIVHAKNSPLELREHTTPHQDMPTVWYVPEAKGKQDWFRDIEAFGGVIETSVEKLSASLFNGISWHDLKFDHGGSPEDSDRNTVAEVLLSQLTHEGNLPTASQLISELLTGGQGNPLLYILKNGWAQMSRETSTIERVSEFLAAEGVPVSGNDAPDDVVYKARKWAVGRWLTKAGVPEDLLSQDHDVASRNWLQNLAAAGESLSDEYLRDYWADELTQVDDPWQFYQCPVDGALDKLLWEDWLTVYEDEDYERCCELAAERRDVQAKLFGTTHFSTALWSQVHYIAQAAQIAATWNGPTSSDDVVTLYADKTRGGWRLDQAIRRIEVQGAVENEFPEWYLAGSSLKELRDDVVLRGYSSYLRDLAQLTTDTLREPQGLLKQWPHVIDFWSRNQRKLSTGTSAAIFFIDALRLDLAREIAIGLEDKGHVVNEDIYIGCLPSETEFGMGALLPDSAKNLRFEFMDNSLVPRRGGKILNTERRKDILRGEGWSEDWQSPQVAYFDTEIDDMGEKGLSGLEHKLRDRINKLVDEIDSRMKQGNLDRCFVVTDHGFVLRPTKRSVVALNPPEGTGRADVRRRFVAAKELADADTGVTFAPGDLPGLRAPLRVLVDPMKRFRKQGFSDKRYSHGGAMPQEFILCFLEVTRG